MRSRGEQVQAYRFVTRRIVSALLSGEPETSEPAMRRLGLAVLSSAMVATIILAGVGVYGFLRPGGSGPEAGSILVERETGARFVYVEEQRALYPVINFASARLIIGRPDAAVKHVSRRSLDSVRRERPVGIPGAPDSIPVPSELLRLPWSVCSAARPGRPATPATQLVIGTELPGASRLGAEEAILVSTDAGRIWLLWKDQRLLVTGRAVLSALGMAATPAYPVGEAFLNGVNPGPDLAPPPVPNLGRPSPVQIQGKQLPIGRVLRTNTQYYLVTGTGLAAIGETSARLLTIDGSAVLTISDSDAGRFPIDTGMERRGFPTTVPKLRELTGPAALCAAYRGQTQGNGLAVTVEVRSQAPELLTGAPATTDGGRPGADGVRTADQVVIQGGHGALVQAMTAAGAPAATVYLVTEQGQKYPLAEATGTMNVDARTALGYGRVQPQAVPATLLALLPTGPTLDAAEAGRPAPAPAPAVSSTTGR